MLMRLFNSIDLIGCGGDINQSESCKGVHVRHIRGVHKAHKGCIRHVRGACKAHKGCA